jgi:hypothetical protein
MNRTSQWTEWHSYFVFRGSLDQISAQKPNTLNEMLVVFLGPFLQMSQEYLPLSDHYFHAHRFQFCFLSCYSKYIIYVDETMSLNKLLIDASIATEFNS